MKLRNDQQSLISKGIFFFAIGVVLFGFSFSAEAQEPKKVPRLGYLSAGVQ